MQHETEAAGPGQLEQAALAYAQEGMHVFPLAPQGKTPLTPHGLEDATTDPMTIETWWSRWPEANIGIRTGDIVVVDEDKPGALDALALSIGETVFYTRTASTGVGSHLYYQQPPGEPIRNTAGRLTPGVDTRGVGGYVVAPPSIHPSGATYAWTNEREIVEMPHWMAERLRKKPVERGPMPDIPFTGTTPYGERALKDEIANVWRAPEGTRNDTLNTAAFALGQLVGGREVEQSDAWQALEAAARACGLPDAESSKTIRSGFSAGLEAPRSAPDTNTGTGVRNGDRPPLRVVEPEPDSHDDDPPALDSWSPINLNDLPETPPVPPQLAETGLVYPGKRHVFSGPPESAKTLAAYCILIQNARLGDRGLLLDFEMGAYDARQRLRELGATAEEIARILYLEPDEGANDQRIFALIAMKPTVVVIDAAAGVYSLEGLDDNKRLDVERVSSLYIRQFWRSGIATILIDHVVKDGEARGRYAIGSERKLGGADVHLGFDVTHAISRGTAGKYKISTHKDRGGYLKRGYLADMNLSSDPETHAITWSFTEPKITTDDEDKFRRTIYMERVSIKLEMAEDPLTLRELRSSVKGDNTYIAEAVETLVHEGYAEVEDGPNRSKLLTSTKPYREADDPVLKGKNEDSGSAVREWFGSGSQTTAPSGGLVVSGLTSPEPPKPPDGVDENPLESAGWFDTEGNLYETPDHSVPDDLDWR